MYKIYVIKESFNDATGFYIKILEDAIIAAGKEVTYISNTSSITKEDVVVTVGNKMFYDACKKHPRSQINWFQGVAPEEVKFSKRSRLGKLFYYEGQCFFERFAVKHTSLGVMVSETMHQHYMDKYGFDAEYFIMPCFNTPLNIEAFKDKYSNPSFVYAGNLAGWQCFEGTVRLFSLIKKEVPAATFTVYTQDKDEASAILDKYGVEKDIRYIPYKELSKEIQNYKYGFLIREDDIVNNVATPTKMNTYLANGIIPIYSTVIGAFKENLANLHYAVPVENVDSCIQKVISIENEIVKSENVLNDFKHIFENYYSRDYYIKELADIIKRMPD